LLNRPGQFFDHAEFAQLARRMPACPPADVAGFAGGTASFVAYGASRAPLLGTVDIDLGATVAPGVDVS